VRAGRRAVPRERSMAEAATTAPTPTASATTTAGLIRVTPLSR
jgi:hypothetical protein